MIHVCRHVPGWRGVTPPYIHMQSTRWHAAIHTYAIYQVARGAPPDVLSAVVSKLEGRYTDGDGGVDEDIR